jgi:hypothetical protein
LIYKKEFTHLPPKWEVLLNSITNRMAIFKNEIFS